MINGIDVQLPTRAGRQALEVAVRAIRQLWPHAVFENAASGDGYEYFWQIPFGEIEEIFVYRDAEAAKTWDVAGAVPDALNTMIHLLHDKGLITVVIDERSDEMNIAVSAIQAALQDAIFTVSTPMEAA
jgi:hypothetical protein